jgi:ATP/maltotriose-dependent transcriptional regulator MalT
VSGDEDAGQWLTWLHRNRLFTDRRPQQHAAESYVYHPLFREFLQARAQSELAPAVLSDLQKRSASLLELAGDVDVAAAL